ncbi:MAG: aminotransferase class I/II-fold pyridoxal phosphate-dependent enzyme [Acidimicrobiales bacterium]
MADADLPPFTPSIVRRTPVPPTVSQPVATPLWPSVVYRAADADELDRIYEGELPGYSYAREGHPNADVLAAKIDLLEGRRPGPAIPAGIVSSSGMAAVSAVVLGLLRAGDHVAAGNQLYGRSLRLVTADLPRMGFATSLFDPTDAASVEAALTPATRMILVEVVSNPTLRVADMEAIVALAQERGIPVVVDNTFTTPRMYQPLAQGADVVIHSVTKLLGGHADVTLGYTATENPDLAAAIRTAAVTWGFAPSPFDCWLAERGLHTFEVRYDRAEANAVAVADALAELAGVRAVLYPGRADHPDRARAQKLFGPRTGNMVSFVLDGGRAEVNAFLRAAAAIPFAPTLGDVATTISHPASSSHRALTAEAREALGMPEGFIRLSVGIEDPDLLIDELSAAVAAARN